MRSRRADRIGFGRFGEIDFAPAARIARKFGQALYAGFEYHAGFGKIDVFDVGVGVGYRFAPQSDRGVVETITGYAFPVPSGDSKSSEAAGIIEGRHQATDWTLLVFIEF